MTTALIAMGVLWVGTVVVGVRALNAAFESTMKHLYEQQQLAHAERLAYMEERWQLLERIQRPEFIPAPLNRTEPEVQAPEEPDWGMVGMVVSGAPEDEHGPDGN
jgi:hypothetical protein